MTLFLLLLPWLVSALESNELSFRNPLSCSTNETYSPLTLTCQTCPPGSAPTPTSCQCLGSHYTKQDTGYYLKDRLAAGKGLSCAPCPEGEVANIEGKGCIRCSQGLTENSLACKTCPEGYIRRERAPDGSPLASVSCLKCSPGSAPDPTGTMCLPCSHFPIVGDLNLVPNCDCSLQGGLCLPANLEMGDILVEASANYNIKYGDHTVVSRYLKERATMAAYMCGKHLNTTACNMLANLCTLTLHTKQHPLCTSLVTIERQNNDLSTRRVPRLFLPEGQVSSTLESESIPTAHSLARGNAGSKGRLNITVVSYAADGTLLGVELASGCLLQLCNASTLVADAAWHFGTKYRSWCRIPAIELWKQPTIFRDLFVPFAQTSSTESTDVPSKLYSVPNRILNDPVNADEDENKNWRLTSRFFLVDSVGGASGNGEKAGIVRYLESLELRVGLLNTRESPEKPGRIHPPLAVLKYKELTLEEAKSGAEVEVSFSVTYHMEMKESVKDIEIAVGVLSGIAVLLSAVEAWSWSRRAGKVAVDFSSLAKMVVATAGNLSYVFLCVIFFSCLYWFIFFKQQSFVHVVLPTGEQEDFIKHYLISAFALKLFHTVALIISQVILSLKRNSPSEQLRSPWMCFFLIGSDLTLRPSLGLSNQFPSGEPTWSLSYYQLFVYC